MAQMIAAVFAKIVVGAKVAAAAAGVGGSTATAATTSAKLLSVLHAGTTAASTIAGFVGQRAKAQALAQEGYQERLNATQEVIQGEQRQNETQRRLLETLANQNVAFAAAGIDTASGTPQAARAAAIQDAERELSVSRDDAVVRASIRRAKGRALAREARAMGVSSTTELSAGLGNAYVEYARRG
jgi:hypothetical protein